MSDHPYKLTAVQLPPAPLVRYFAYDRELKFWLGVEGESIINNPRLYPAWTNQFPKPDLRTPAVKAFEEWKEREGMPGGCVHHKTIESAWMTAWEESRK